MGAEQRFPGSVTFRVETWVPAAARDGLLEAPSLVARSWARKRSSGRKPPPSVSTMLDYSMAYVPSRVRFAGLRPPLTDRATIAALGAARHRRRVMPSTRNNADPISFAVPISRAQACVRELRVNFQSSPEWSLKDSIAGGCRELCIGAANPSFCSCCEISASNRLTAACPALNLSPPRSIDGTAAGCR